MKKVLRLLSLLSILCLVFTGCGSEDAENPNAEFKIGIMQLMDHEALNQAQDGFIDALADNGYVDGENITLLLENGQGDTNNLSTIADKFMAEEVDLAFTIATPSTQAMAGKTTSIPIVATAVTSFTAAGLVQSDEQPGGNITGTSDMNPIADQMELLLTLCPDAKTVGFLYTASEDNSILQCKIAREYLEAKGIATVERTIINTNDVQQAATALVEECDAVYVPTDNNCASAMPTISEATMTAGIPLIVGETNNVKAGGTATVGITYYGLGYQAGLMAIDILVNGADPATMPIQSSSEFEYCLNGTLLDQLGIEIPAELQQYAFYAE
ncbi:MAG: ABC transporter substrate-binding protein [Firmicutes bacterium]|nr:ABC transporter substrate-binding protein [Bacillota bacterium]MBQ3199234.1 ABC transporter substrate-binding protein [Bacillota bacterium]